MADDGVLNDDALNSNNSVDTEIFLQDEDLSELSQVQQGFIRVIRGIEREIGDTTTGNNVREMVAEAYPPESLFDPELAAYPKIYLKLRSWLEKHGAGLGQHPSRRVYNLLAERLYSLEADVDQAKLLVRELFSRNRGQRGGGPPNGGGQRGSVGQMSADRIGQSIGMRYSKDSMKFTGAEDQAFHEYVGFYLKVARDFSLTNEQKLMFMYNIFAGEAMRFFDSHVDGHVETFSEAVLMMNKQYNSTTRQTAVQNRLTNLRHSKLVAKGMGNKEALEHVYETITKLSPQLPMNYRDDSHKRDYLRVAVVGISWARPPLGRLATVEMSFEQLYAELVSSLQLEEEFEEANDPVPSAASTAPATQGGAKQTFFAGQGMYGRPSKGVGSTRPGYSKSGGPPAKDGRGGRFDPLSIAGCFNCDDPKHLLKNCPKPINTIKATERKVAYYDKKTKGGRASVAAVLYQLALQVNPSATVGDANDLEDALIFGRIEDGAAAVEAADQHYVEDPEDEDDNAGQGSSSSSQQVGFHRGV